MKKLVLCAIGMFALFISHGQVTPSKLNLIIAYDYSLSPKVAFINGEEGKLISSVTVEEPIYYVAKSDDDATFYLQTRHSVYTGEIATGKITNTYKAYDKLENAGAVNVDNLIIPAGISSQGVALYCYNKELIATYQEMANASPLKMAKIATKAAELGSTIPVYQHDIHSKEVTLFDTYTALDKGLMYLTSDSKLWFWSYDTKTITKEDFDSEDELFSYELEDALLRNNTLAELRDKPMTPTIVSDSQFGLAINSYDPKQLLKTMHTLYDARRRRLSEVSEMDVMVLNYPLRYIDCTQIVYGVAKSTFNQPMPQAPVMGKVNPLSYKKKMAEFEAKNEAFQDDLMDWYADQRLAKNFDLVVYSDPDYKTEVLRVNKASKGTLFNDKMLFVQGAESMMLYDVETGEQKWNIEFSL